MCVCVCVHCAVLTIFPPIFETITAAQMSSTAGEEASY